MANSLKFTKIVATVSGRDCTLELMNDLYKRGMNVVRMNSAHMSIEEMKKIITFARKVSSNLAVMIDTKGPNIRTCGMPENGLAVKKGEKIVFSGRDGKGKRVKVNYPPFASEVEVGSKIVCDDGAAVFFVTGKKGGDLTAEAAFDCVVLDRKSVNVPDSELNPPALSEKDKLFLAAAVKFKCDFVAHSFVRNADDVLAVRKELGKAGKDIGIIAKIENRQGVRNIDEILDAADGIMVARGDLGIEIPLEEVPAIQKKLIHAARKVAKPVITATQMLQSMEQSPSPTRAEVSDVANAVYDGTDAVMLSGETAHGKYPREAVEVMSRIVREAEKAPVVFFPKLDDVPEDFAEPAFVIASAVQAASELKAKAIICSTASGTSARVCSALRPCVPIHAPTPYEISVRKLALSYGVFPILSEYDKDPYNQAAQAIKSTSAGALKLKGDDLVIIVAKHTDTIARNNLFCISRMKDFKCFK